MGPLDYFGSVLLYPLRTQWSNMYRNLVGLSISTEIYIYTKNSDKEKRED